jgi:hypothetical protein
VVVKRVRRKGMNNRDFDVFIEKKRRGEGWVRRL